MSLTAQSYSLTRARAVCHFILFVLLLAVPLRADTISGKVKDPSGSLVAGAKIEISGEGLAKPLEATSDENGKFAATDLKPGKYTVTVTKDGFALQSLSVELRGTSDLSVTLTIAEQSTTVSVTGKSLAFLNSDPIYRQLRDIGLGDAYPCENFKFNMDVATFELKSGTLVFLEPVNGLVTGAVFSGQGHFLLTPLTKPDKSELERRSGSQTAEEEFTEAVLRFNGRVYQQMKGALGGKPSTVPPEAGAILQRWRSRVRHRHMEPEGFTQAILESETMDNVDADMLAAVSNPKHPQIFDAYMSGKPHKDFRYFVRARVGAVPQMDSPEEVALINVNGANQDDGVWYSEHLAAELRAGTADSAEEKRMFLTKRYKIETVIGKNNHFASRTSVTFVPLFEGERVLKFGLLPNLRVIRVAGEDGRDLRFIQEGWKEDGSFYAVLDSAPSLGKEHTITIDYVGDRVLYDAGGGSYYVSARESWYPNLNGFGEKALYDLTFKVPKSNALVSVGDFKGESEEAGFTVSHWVTPVPIGVAGFNYGKYKRIETQDPITHYNLNGYYLTELPSSLSAYRDSALEGMAPTATAKYALEQARAQMQLCTHYFGRAPFETVAITEQPNFSFGQSWPGLVYLPISAYIDSTQRWQLFGQIDSNFTGFVQEVTPHEVAHQWFGHSVMWASYHDQWLSEGFADFAAGLFLREAMGPKWQKEYFEYWDRQRKRILEKNNFGISPNDAGPLWLGLRLISPKSGNAYQGVTYSKGGYVLLMLNSMMYNDQAASGDPNEAFIEMMHDFIRSHQEKPASTESFKAIVEKHMPKKLDLQRNGRLDWFFDEWVYGNKVPHYELNYERTASDGKGARIKVNVTQSEVDDNFAMFVPVFGDFGSGFVRIGQVLAIGNKTSTAVFNFEREPKKLALNSFKDVLERK